MTTMYPHQDKGRDLCRRMGNISPYCCLRVNATVKRQHLASSSVVTRVIPMKETGE